MIMPLDNLQWQVLRKLLREKSCQGNALRITLSRRTKGLKHLDKLVMCGLIEKTKIGQYVLTDKGTKAAEFGEFECDESMYKTIVNN